jgi:hypothetical protein
VNLPNSDILPTQTDGGFLEGGPLDQGAEEETAVQIPENGNPEASSHVFGNSGVDRSTRPWPSE